MAVEPEQRLAEALRARATGAGAPPAGRYVVDDEPEQAGMRLPTALLIALLVGIALGAALAVLSLLVPGALPGTA